MEVVVWYCAMHGVGDYMAATSDSGGLRLIDGRSDPARSQNSGALRWLPTSMFLARVYARLLNLDNHLNFHRAIGRKCLHSNGGACVLADLLSEYFHH